MAHIELTGSELVLHLSTAEKVAALHGELSVPLERVSDVEVVEHAHREVHGVRVGTGLPGLLPAGRFFGGEGESVAICHGTKAGVVITLSGGSPERIIITCDEPRRLASQIRLAAHLGH